MHVLQYLGTVCFFLLFVGVVTLYDGRVARYVTRQTSLPGPAAALLTGLVVAWALVPILAGAPWAGTTWYLGVGFTALGGFLLALAFGSVGEYRLLERVPHRGPAELSAADVGSVVAVSGVPAPLDGAGTGTDETTPFAGTPTAHTDWLVQERGRAGLKALWRILATGTQHVAFALGDGAVEVAAGDRHVVTPAGNRVGLAPGDDVPEPAATTLREHPDLPSPDDLARPLRAVEVYVPAEDPVTVVGPVERAEDGRLRVGGAGDADGSAALLVSGDRETARSALRKRVRTVGVIGLTMLLGGQALSFWLSGATLAALA